MKYQLCSLFSGSSGNATFLGNSNTNILIDAGKSCKQITTALKHLGISPKDLDCILVTHEHSDHIKSIGIMSRTFNIPIYANEKTWVAMESSLKEVSSHNVKVFETTKSFTVRDIAVNSFNIPHDAASPVGFYFNCGNKKVSVTTDIGHINADITGNIYDSDIVVLEANHDAEMLRSGPYPGFLKKRILGQNGHLSNNDAGKALVEMVKRKVTHAVLAHLSQENNLPQLAFNTVKSILDTNGIHTDKDIVIDIAHRNIVGNIYYI